MLICNLRSKEFMIDVSSLYFEWQSRILQCCHSTARGLIRSKTDLKEPNSLEDLVRLKMLICNLGSEELMIDVSSLNFEWQLSIWEY